ncbi:hypothetical protein [Burkholderia ubonensis]|uniref:hypothetical protein n=1 Tax=Burkholderia ubonensis TaxID=101571 RepID=UPI000752F67B|nr:hypothetical protein [Burkholderia ubonensis]KVP39897.1 hypothetical protein WJ87_06855 [Burkholderia ubonensis]
MGKESRRKQVEVSEETKQGIRWAAEIIRDPRVLNTFSCIERLGSMRKDQESADMMAQVGAVADFLGEEELAESLKRAPWVGALAAKQLRDVTPEQWATGMTAAFRNAKFVSLLESIVAIAHRSFWSSDPANALRYGGNGKAPADDPRMLAIARAHRRLSSDPAGPGWVTLALFCLARMIAVNSQRLFDSNEWSDATFLWFALERDFLTANGASTAKLVVEADSKLFGHELAGLVGSRMMHGLAEAAVNAYDKPFFH